MGTSQLHASSEGMTMTATFYVINYPLGAELVEVRAYTVRGGELVAVQYFTDILAAREWRI
jgi:hypothetical protein